MAASGLVPLEQEVGKLHGHEPPSLPAPPPPTSRGTGAARRGGRRSGKRKIWLSSSQPTTFTSGTRPLGSSSHPHLSDIRCRVCDICMERQQRKPASMVDSDQDEELARYLCRNLRRSLCRPHRVFERVLDVPFARPVGTFGNSPAIYRWVSVRQTVTAVLEGRSILSRHLSNILPGKDGGLLSPVAPRPAWISGGTVNPACVSVRLPCCSQEVREAAE